MENLKILIMPGLGGSDENHWQSFWLNEFNNAVQLTQNNWNEPNLDDWLSTLNDQITTINTPIILVAHSLAVSLVLHWANKYKNKNILGALLVAPADVESANHTPEVVRGFADIPKIKLPFPSIMIASTNDNYISLNRAEYFAEKWGSDFINIGAKGHINSDSNLKIWKEGQLILQELVKKVTE